MLWPDDEEARERAMQAATVQFGRDLKRNGLLSADEISELAELAVDAPRPVDMIEAAKEQCVQGMVAGFILHRALAYKDFAPDKAAIGRNVKELSARLWPAWRLRPQTINNKVLPRFRPVAHFWAASVAGTLNGSRDFPCRRADLPIFLAIAEEYRKLGEATRLPHAPSTVLRAGECIAVPPSISLPKITLEFLKP